MKLCCTVLLSMLVLYGAIPNILSAQSHHVTYTAEFSQSDLLFRKTDTYDVIRLQNADVFCKLGNPLVPVKTLKIAIPSGTSALAVEAQSLASEEMSGSFLILPGQPPLQVGETKADVFVAPNPEVYASTSAYPGVLATLDHQANCAGQQIVFITVYPLQYVPAEKHVTLHTRIALTIQCVPDNASGNKALEQYYKFSENQRILYEDMLKSIVVNPEAVRILPLQGGPSRAVPPGDYDHVIITTNALKPYLNQLVYWHMKKGIRDTVVTTEWIYANYSGAADTIKIRQFVIDANTNWGTMYFLMGGENANVPYGQRHYYGDYPDQIAPSDQYYSDFDDDWIHEVYVGRASGDSQTQFNIFINKVLMYEKNPPLTNYPAEVLLIGMNLDDTTPTQLLKDSIAKFVPPTFTKRTVYDSEGGNHADSVRYYLNQGNNLVNHMDHSNKTVMGTGYHYHGWSIGNTDVDNLTNNNQMSIITSGGCEPAGLDYDDCIAEHFVIYNDLQAGVAFIGNTRHGWYYGGDPYTLSNELDLWFWHGLFTQNKDDLGKALVYAKHQFAQPNSWDKACEWHVNLIGEPAMPVWTAAPAQMLVTYNSTVPNAPVNFTVTVKKSDGVTPIQGALVCCWIPDQSPQMHVTALTNASGIAVLSISPTTDGDTMLVTVTMRNYIPHEGYSLVDAVPPAAPHITHVQKTASNVRLVWNKVTTDTLGYPEAVSLYKVFRSTVPSFIPSTSDSIGVVYHPDTVYTDIGALTTAANYYYLVRAVNTAGTRSKNSNMGYKFNKLVNENSSTTDRNWVSLPWHSSYGDVSDMTTDLSPLGDPLTKVTNLRNDNLYESWLWDPDFGEWYGTDFGITPGRGYEMVTMRDDTVVVVGCNDPAGLVPLNENPATTDRNWVSIPYSHAYTSVSDITTEYSPLGNPLTKLTNLRNDNLYESWLWDPDFGEWYGTDFGIDRGQGYEMVAVVDTVWNPTEYSNESGLLFVRHTKQTDMCVSLGSVKTSGRAPVWVEDRKVSLDATRAKGTGHSDGVSHIVLAHLSSTGLSDIRFTVYRNTQPCDVITEEMIGSCVVLKGERAAIVFDVGNFKTPWNHGDELILIVEAEKQDRGYFAVRTVNLDTAVDVQELGTIVLAPIPMPARAQGRVQWAKSNDENIIGYSLYYNNERINTAVITETDYSIDKNVALRPVLRGGYETVYSSGAQGGVRGSHTPLAYAFKVFPNPFTTRMSVDYALPHAALVSISVYDVTGEKVSTLVNNQHEPGYYTTVWNGQDDKGRTASSGVYFFRFDAGTFHTNDKIILLR